MNEEPHPKFFNESIWKRMSFNGADGISDIEGKAAMGSGE
jgi:hypothetical protein